MHIPGFLIAMAAQFLAGIVLLFRERGEDDQFTGGKLIYRS
jgi:hypothetical protein